MFMCPSFKILGLDLYSIAICIGIILCFGAFSILVDKRKIPVRVQKLAIFAGMLAIIVGYASAVLVQALYNIKSLGRFELNLSTGATFYGGLIGGVLFFLLIYFGIGHFIFKESIHGKSFFSIASSAVPGIAIAHCLGRIGCLTAGCCHGRLTDAWYGIMMWGSEGYAKYVPVQLFEAVFLLILFAFLFIRAYKGGQYGLSLYLIIYGVWRFFLEYIRGDFRGDTFISFFTPSQLTALLLISVGFAVIAIEKYFYKVKFQSKER